MADVQCQSTSVNFYADSLPMASPGPLPEEGLTVPGSESQQQFQQGYLGQLEANSEVIIIRIKGTQGYVQVTRPVIVNTKLTCPTCGRASTSAAKFCINCGTAL